MQLMPANQFSVINKKHLMWSADTLVHFYLPIIGFEAFTVYEYLALTDVSRISDILNHLNIGKNNFNEALDKLSAMDLLNVYTDKKQYQLELRSPKNPKDFLADEFYSRLLISKIGQEAFENLSQTAEKLPQKISKKFSDVYKINFSGIVESALPKEKDESFDITSFKSIMRKQHLTFKDENTDILRLYELADKCNLNWYEAFKLAEKTANADRSINIDAMLYDISAKNQDPVDLSTFSDDEKQLISIAKSVSPEDFLTSLKGQEGGFVTTDERKILVNLSRQNIESQVQNVLIHYSLIQTNQASLNEKFVDRIANDWKRNKVVTAELALKRILSFNQEKVARESQSSYARANNKADTTKSSAQVPTWHNEQDYKNETSSEELEKLERLRQEALRDIQGASE